MRRGANHPHLLEVLHDVKSQTFLSCQSATQHTISYRNRHSHAPRVAQSGVMGVIAAKCGRNSSVVANGFDNRDGYRTFVSRTIAVSAVEYGPQPQTTSP